MRIEIVIDELVLHGVDARDRHRVADALQGELTRLVATDPQRWRHVPAIDVLHVPERVVVPHGGGSGPAALGTQLAGALAATMTGPRARAAQALLPPLAERPAPPPPLVQGRTPPSPHAQRPASSPPLAQRRTWDPASARFRSAHDRGTP
jgi:hypothetical protein